MSFDQERLRLLGLPVFDGFDELALLIHIDPRRLEQLTYYSSKHYYHFQIAKKHGGIRDIYQPCMELKALQAWILRNILDKLSTSAQATAFIRGKGLLENVKPHADNRYFVCMDIEDFFPSIRFYSVKRIFELIGYSPESSKLLSRICTCNNTLPQGGVTSPSLSNLVSSKLDRRLSGLTSRRNIVYTRYADDMTFSSNNRNQLNKSIPLIEEIIRSEHFTPHPKKTRAMGPKIHCQITGLVKNSSAPKFGVGRQKKREMRAIMHAFCEGRASGEKFSTEQSIEGWLSFVKCVDVESYAQMDKYWEHLGRGRMDGVGEGVAH
jgi:retron-type reverse transcriptase